MKQLFKLQNANQKLFYVELVKWSYCLKNSFTFASVGTPSFSLSASETSHGDLGMI